MQNCAVPSILSYRLQFKNPKQRTLFFFWYLLAHPWVICLRLLMSFFARVRTKQSSTVSFPQCFIALDILTLGLLPNKNYSSH